MKHPNLNLIDVRCLSCGTSHTIRSTSEILTVEVCSNCHPAYTGRQRVAVSGDMVERFNRRRALAAA